MVFIVSMVKDPLYLGDPVLFFDVEKRIVARDTLPTVFLIGNPWSRDEARVGVPCAQHETGILAHRV